MTMKAKNIVLAKQQPLGSLVFSSQEEIAAAYKPKTQEELGASLKSGGKVKTQPAVHVSNGKKHVDITMDETSEKSDEDAKAPKLVALSEKAGKKKPTVEPAPTTPPMKSTLHQALKRAGFKFAQAVRAGDAVAYGYVHKDKRAALLTVTPDGSELCTIKWPGEGGEQVTTDVERLTNTLRITSSKRRASLDRTAKRLEADKTKAAALAEAQLEAAKDTDVAMVAAPVVAQLLPSGPPDHVCKALLMLDNLTAHQFNMDMLRGDKHYSNRVALLRTLCNRGKGDYKVAETGINLLTQGFYTSVGVGEGTSRAAQAKTFAERCADIVKAFKAAQAAARKVEKKAELMAWRVERTKYEVPGVILPHSKPMSKKKRAAEDAAAREEIHARVLALAVSPEQPAVPNPDVELNLVVDELQLLEDPKNHLVMMQMERANSQGAICIYNNGSRVATGVVPLETLRKLRPVKTDPENGLDVNTMLLQVAHQLLNPTVPGVPVTPVAARHLTAVTDCKELIVKNKTAVSSGRKFAAPAAATKSIVKAPKAPKAAKAPKAPKVKTASTPRGSYVGKKIKVLNKKHDAREGTKRAKALDILLSAKTTDEAIPKLAKIGANNTFIAFAIAQKFIALA